MSSVFFVRYWDYGDEWKIDFILWRLLYRGNIDKWLVVVRVKSVWIVKYIKDGILEVIMSLF